MAIKLVVFSLLIFNFSNASGATNQIEKTYNEKSNYIENLYRSLHKNPELSGKEFKTAKRMANEMKKLGLKVTENFGGTGVVGVLKNGKGPTIWLRADMDALPIQEKTKKKYASQVPGVMHACGHDTHMAALIGYADVLIKLKNQWQGTLVFISQPAEEIGAGAQSMIDAGLFKKFPKPDYILGLHVSGTHDSGKISFTSGYAMAAVDAIDIEVRGLGGHGSTPERTIDPVMLASKIVVNSQTLVSRNIDPRDPVVLTFGSVHGGTKHNIIPDSVHLQATLRTYSDEVRKKMLSGIKRMAYSLAEAEQAPKPIIKFDEGLPATYNDPKLTQRMIPIFEKVVGKKNVIEERGIMGAEDFAIFSQDKKYPTTFFFIGGAPKNKSHFGMNHNAKFAPEYKSVINIGVRTMTQAVLELAPVNKLSAK